MYVYLQTNSKNYAMNFKKCDIYSNSRVFICILNFHVDTYNKTMYRDRPVKFVHM